MRYKIIAKTDEEERTIYTTGVPLKSVALIDPVLHMEADSSGSFECMIPPDNVCTRPMKDGSPFVQKMRTKISVWNDSKSKKIWEGRVLSFDTDITNTPSLHVEGAMSYFNDTVQRPRIFGRGQIPSGTKLVFSIILSDILNEHNRKLVKTKDGQQIAYNQILIGDVTIPDELFNDAAFVVERETTMSTLTKLKSTYGGYFRVSYREGDERGYLDWFQTYNTDENYKPQQINFGVNLIDFTRKTDSSTLANVILPLGSTINSAGSIVIGENIPIIDTDIGWGGPDAAGNYLAFANGYRIVAADNTYIYQEEVSNCCTGYWDHYNDTDRHHSLKVYPGEVYYLNCFATASTTMYIITQGRLGRNGTYVRSVRNANSSWNEGTQLKFQKVTVPDLKYEDGCMETQLYLNMSALKAHMTINSVSDINMSIYRGRTVANYMDERITLLGLDDGKPLPNDKNMNYYLDNNENVLIIPTPIEDGWYDLNRTFGPDSFPDERVMPRSEFPEPTSPGMIIGSPYVDSDTGNIYRVEPVGGPTNYQWVMLPDNKAYKKEGLYLIDVESVAKYGRIEKTLDLSDVTEPSDLLQSSIWYLFNTSIENINIDVSALDLAILDNTVESPDVLDPIIVKSEIHGVDVVIPVQERDIPFNKLESQTFSLGYEKNRRITDTF